MHSAPSPQRVPAGQGGLQADTHWPSMHTKPLRQPGTHARSTGALGSGGNELVAGGASAGACALALEHHTHEPNPINHTNRICAPTLVRGRLARQPQARALMMR